MQSQFFLSPKFIERFSVKVFLPSAQNNAPGHETEFPEQHSPEDENATVEPNRPVQEFLESQHPPP